MGNNTKIENTGLRTTAAILAGLCALSVVGALVPGWKLWGIAVWPVYPAWLMFALLALAVVGAVLMFRFSQSMPTTGVAEYSPSQPAWIWWVAALVVLAVLTFLRTDNYLLGDGFSIIDRTSTGNDFADFSQINVLIHRILYDFLPGEPAARTVLAYRVTSFVSGAITLIAIAQLFQNLRSRLISLAVFLTFGFVLMFAGYVERYPITFALSFLFLVLAYQDWQNSRIRIWTIVVFAAAVAMHLLVALWLPVILLLLMKRSGIDNPKKYWLLLSALLVIGFLAYVFTSSGSESFIPLFANATSAYSLFSSSRWIDLLNVMLLSFPVILIIFALRSFWRSTDIPFHLFAIIVPLAATVIIDPKLGALRDWDLMSFAGVPVLLAGSVMLARLGAAGLKATSGLIVLLLAFATLHTGSWLVLNTSQSRSQEVMKTIVRDDAHYAGTYQGGIQNVQWSIYMSKFCNDWPECILAQERRLAGAPGDDLNRYNLAVNYSKGNKWTEASDLISGRWRSFPADARYLNRVTEIFTRSGNKAELEQVYEYIVEKDSTAIPILFELSRVKEQRGVADSACYHYKRALERAGQTDPRFYWKYVQLCLNARQTNEALSTVGQLRGYVSQDDQQLVAQVEKLIRAGDNESALRLVQAQLTGR